VLQCAASCSKHAIPDEIQTQSTGSQTKRPAERNGPICTLSQNGYCTYFLYMSPPDTKSHQLCHPPKRKKEKEIARKSCFCPRQIEHSPFMMCQSFPSFAVLRATLLLDDPEVAVLPTLVYEISCGCQAVPCM